MLLCVDVGNSNIVLGGYFKGQLRFVSRVATDVHMEADQYAVLIRNILSLYAVRETVAKAAITSVVPGLTQVVCRALSHFLKAKPLVLGTRHAKSLGINIEIENPKELGTDILASAIAVRHTQKLPAVIVDMGTATKLCALNANGALLGVSICPGLYVSMQALVKRASALKGVPLNAPAFAIGKNTAESMKSGVIFGSADMLDGLVDRFEKEMGGLCSVVATGGAAGLISPHCRHKITVKDTLVLDGLHIFSQNIAREEDDETT